MTLSLFEGYGIELEYMVVDRKTLQVRPIVDQLLLQVAGSYEQEVERGAIAWSNELALHVVELKTNGPAGDLSPLSSLFHQNVLELNRLLEKMDARLMPTAIHPFMNPEREMQLWPHGDREIYNAYHRIFGCEGHGWSNLQSTHINLPFCGDAEFKKLHAALRFVMPLLPGLWASSPVVEGKLTPFDDNRLEFYRNNQRKVPLLTGQVIPEAVYSKAGYESLLQDLYTAISPFDPKALLQFEWLNSRGAIARFDRMAIELRTLDIQECPLADLALASGLVALLKRLVFELDIETISTLSTEALAADWRAALKSASPINLAPYAKHLQLKEAPDNVLELWRALSSQLEPQMPESYRPAWKSILERGSLAAAIRSRLAEDCHHSVLLEVYEELCDCLQQNRIYLKEPFF